jgi:hypothetical protein
MAFRPAVVAQAVGVKPVAVLEQAGEGAEEDHARAKRRGYCSWYASNTCLRFHNPELRPRRMRIA